MADVHLTLTADQATELLGLLEETATADRAANSPRRVSVAEAQRMLVVWSLRDAMRKAGVRIGRRLVGQCDE